MFAVESGNNLVYIPVAMSYGAIVSCEMAYNKESDQFFPLDEHTVKEILGASAISDPAILNSNPRVEDTRALFRNMVRPPVSSNVILAGERVGISSLPDERKAELANYLLEENPALLGKVASFYDVSELGWKLALRPREKVAAAPEESTFKSLRSLTKEAARALSPEERKTILECGYLIKSSSESQAVVASPDDLRKTVESLLQIELYTPQKNDGPFHVAQVDVVCVSEKGIEFVPCLLCREFVLAKDGRECAAPLQNTFNPFENAPASFLVRNLDYRHVAVDSFPQAATLSSLRKKLADHVRIDALAPSRNGGWLDADSRIYAYANEIKIADGAVGTTSPLREVTLQTSESLRFGFVKQSGATILPADCRFVVRGKREKLLVPCYSIDKLLRMLSLFGQKLNIRSKSGIVSITDSEKTASFSDRAGAARHLH